MFLPTLENWPEEKNIQVLENYESDKLKKK